MSCLFEGLDPLLSVNVESLAGVYDRVCGKLEVVSEK